jgi:hypothetical protein
LKTSSLAAIAVISLVSLAIPSSYAQLGNESITINTQKSAYGPGDTVNLTGLVNDGTPGQLVAIQVKDAKGNLILIRTVQEDQNGNFNLQFKVPLTASPGSLNITASARIDGFVITQSKDTTTPVPEFPASGIVLAASIASLIFYGIISNQGLGIKLGGGK